MTTVRKRIVTSEDATQVGVLSIHKMTEWLNSAVTSYSRSSWKLRKLRHAKMNSIEFHTPVFVDDVLSFDCDRINENNSPAIKVKVLRNNKPVIESNYIRS